MSVQAWSSPDFIQASTRHLEMSNRQFNREMLTRPLNRMLLKHAKSGKRLFEIGYGGGALYRWSKLIDLLYSGVDVSESGVEWVPRADRDSFIVGDASFMKINETDYIYANETLEYMAAPISSAWRFCVEARLGMFLGIKVSLRHLEFQARQQAHGSLIKITLVPLFALLNCLSAHGSLHVILRPWRPTNLSMKLGESDVAHADIFLDRSCAKGHEIAWHQQRFSLVRMLGL